MRGDDSSGAAYAGNGGGRGPDSPRLPCGPPPPRVLRLPANSASLEVQYLDVANTMPVVAIWLADHPREVLPILGEAAKAVALEVRRGGGGRRRGGGRALLQSLARAHAGRCPWVHTRTKHVHSHNTHAHTHSHPPPQEFEDYGNVAEAVHVRIGAVPLQESLRDLRRARVWGGGSAQGVASGLGGVRLRGRSPLAPCHSRTRHPLPFPPTHPPTHPPATRAGSSTSTSWCVLTAW